MVIMAAKATQAGSIKKLAPGKYQAVLYAGRDVLKRERRVTKVFAAPNDRAAGKKAIGVFGDLQARVDGVQRRKGTVAELADDWLRSKAHGSPATIDGVRPHIASIKRHLGRFQVDDLTGEHVDAWLEELRSEKVARQRSEATIHHYYATLRTMLRWARRKRRATTVATEFADAPKPLGYEVRPPTGDAVALVLAAAGGDFRVAIELAAASAMRRGELVALRWTDLKGTRLRIERAIVETDGGGVRVKAPKSGKARTISLAAETVAMLHAHHASLLQRSPGLRDDAYVFPAFRLAADGSEPHRPTWINQSWERLRKLTGAEFRWHDVRHWAASEMLARGVPLAVVADRLGHTKQTTTLSIYSHVLDENDDVAAAETMLALGRG